MMRKTNAINLALVTSLAVAVSGCQSVCSSEPIAMYKAKSSSYSAKLNRKNCGATARYVYELFVSKVEGKNGDLALRFDDNGSQSWPDDERELLHLKLVRSAGLQVQITEPVRVFTARGEAGGLKVRYIFRPGTKIM